MFRWLGRLLRAGLWFAVSVASAIAVVVVGAWVLAFVGLVTEPQKITDAIWTALIDLDGWRQMLAVALGGTAGFFLLGEMRGGGED